jgi:hypothetical protein
VTERVPQHIHEKDGHVELEQRDSDRQRRGGEKMREEQGNNEGRKK